MTRYVQGLHHITALASDPQKNVHFYTAILGVRLVKKTINFDAPDVYHLYYGDEKGTPGTLLTFFPYPAIPKGRRGKGQVTTVSFSIAEQAVEYWIRRFTQFKVRYEMPIERFDEVVIPFEDTDGLSLELVATKSDARTGWSRGPIPPEYAIKGLYGMTLTEEGYEKTADLLTKELEHTLIAEEGNRFRYAVHKTPGSFVDLLCSPDAFTGMLGSGTVHHAAYATESTTSQQEARTHLMRYGLNVTPILDRSYFHSIYFREPGGVLFEIATTLPGFTIDEPLTALGTSLKLPPWAEKNRTQIENLLPPIRQI